MKINLPKKYLHLENRDKINRIINNISLDFGSREFEKQIEKKYIKPKWCIDEDALKSGIFCFDLLYGMRYLKDKPSINEQFCSDCCYYEKI